MDLFISLSVKGKGYARQRWSAAFRTLEMQPTVRTKLGEVRIVDSSIFKVSANVAMAMVTLSPGGLRELHWHPNADEWQYYIAGKGRMTVISTRHPSS